MIRLQRRHDIEAPLDFATKCQLVRGLVPFAGMRMLTRSQFDALWERHRLALIAEFVAKYPAQRPFAWWLNDHGSERPVTRGAPKWLVDRYRQDDGLRLGARFEFLHTAVFAEFAGRWQAIQQPEPDYLAKHDLLDDGELEALATDV